MVPAVQELAKDRTFKVTLKTTGASSKRLQMFIGYHSIPSPTRFATITFQRLLQCDDPLACRNLNDHCYSCLPAGDGEGKALAQACNGWKWQQQVRSDTFSSLLPAIVWQSPQRHRGWLPTQNCPFTADAGLQAAADL